MENGNNEGIEEHMKKKRECGNFAVIFKVFFFMAPSLMNMEKKKLSKKFFLADNEYFENSFTP